MFQREPIMFIGALQGVGAAAAVIAASPAITTQVVATAVGAFVGMLVLALGGRSRVSPSGGAAAAK
jgi:hypothetical protein